MRKIKHRIRLPKEEEESPSLKKFKTQLGRALNNLGSDFIKGLEQRMCRSALQSMLSGDSVTVLMMRELWHQRVNRKQLCKKFRA